MHMCKKRGGQRLRRAEELSYHSQRCSALDEAERMLHHFPPLISSLQSLWCCPHRQFPYVSLKTACPSKSISATRKAEIITMTTPKVLIPMADYGHDPTGELSSLLILCTSRQILIFLRDRGTVYRIQKGRLWSPVCDRDWEGAGMRQEDVAGRHSKATRANPSFTFPPDYICIVAHLRIFHRALLSLWSMSTIKCRRPPNFRNLSPGRPPTSVSMHTTLSSSPVDTKREFDS